MTVIPCLVAVSTAACGDSEAEASTLTLLPLAGAASVANVIMSLDQPTILPGAAANATA